MPKGETKAREAFAIERLGDVRCTLGESPVWDEVNERVLLVDIIGRAVHSVSVRNGRSQRWSMPSETSALGLCADGRRWVVALRHKVILFDPLTSEAETLAVMQSEPATNRLNDGKVGPDGAFWVGSMDDRAEKEPTAHLYRVGATGNIERVLSALTVANGLAWTGEGTRMFHADSPRQEIRAFSFDAASGALGAAAPFAKLSAGFADGGATDVEGCYWSCAAFAGTIHRFAPDGALLTSLSVPIRTPTSLCFGGPDMRTMFITSMRDEQHALEDSAGCLFATRVDVAGVPVCRFG